MSLGKRGRQGGRVWHQPVCGQAGLECGELLQPRSPRPRSPVPRCPTIQVSIHTVK